MSSITPTGGRHLALGEIVRLVPARGGFTPRGRAGLIATPSALARHAATLTVIGAATALAGTSATAIALMLGLGR